MVGIVDGDRVPLEGVSGRRDGESLSARRINCKAARGEPLGEEGVDRIERGLLPLGVLRANEGMKGRLGSGVRGGDIGRSLGSGGSIAARARLAELIHFSSRPLPWGGESGIGRMRNASAK